MQDSSRSPAHRPASPDSSLSGTDENRAGRVVTGSQTHLTYRAYLRSRFGRPVLIVSLNAGFSCPNREDGAQGCAFCDNRGFSPAVGHVGPALDQLTEAISRARGRFDAFIAYLQPYSNTYAPVEHLREVYEPLIRTPGVVGLAVGTRPDCLSGEVCDYLTDVNHRTYLSMEIGLQSSHDPTLQRVNRGHSYEHFVVCVNELSRRGVECVAHVILGLPGETRAMMMTTAQRLADLPVAGVKIHQLMVFAGTALERHREELSLLSLDEYARLVVEFISYLRPDQRIHRLVADSNPAMGLVAPLWSADKTAALQRIHEVLRSSGERQGSRFRGETL